MYWCPRSLALITLLRLSLADALRIDDFDKLVEYHGAWTDGHDIPDDASLNWDSTLRYSNISGATATLNFTGTSIAVFGSFHPPGRYSMQSQYAVDDAQPFTFIPDQEVPTALHQILFYSSGQLPYGEHSLVVTNLGEQLFLDFFDVQNETSSTPPPSTTLSAAATSAIIEAPTSSLAPPVGGSQTMTVTTTSPNTQPEASSSHATQVPQDTGADSIPSPTTSSPVVGTVKPQPSASWGTRTALASNSATTTNSTATPVSAAQASASGSSHTLSKGAIAGIAVGSLIIVAVLAAAIWWYRRSRVRTWLVTDHLHFGKPHPMPNRGSHANGHWCAKSLTYFAVAEPAKMSAPRDPSFRGHRPTLPGMSDARDVTTVYGEHRASERRLSTPSSSVHIVGYGASTSSTYSE